MNSTSTYIDSLENSTAHESVMESLKKIYHPKPKSHEEDPEVNLDLIRSKEGKQSAVSSIKALKHSFAWQLIKDYLEREANKIAEEILEVSGKEETIYTKTDLQKVKRKVYLHLTNIPMEIINELSL